jgi:tetratricopeptide (TPR) repeat protein
MSDREKEEGKAAAMGGASRWTRRAVLGAVCALVIGVYARTAHSGILELMGSGARESYYNLLVRGFQDGHLSVKREVPPGLGDPPQVSWYDDYGLDELSYYKGRLYLYFGVTPALVVFWPCAALTGHYLSHKDAVLFFFSVGFLAGAGLLRAMWRRYFQETSLGVVAAGTLAFGLANFAPIVLGRCDVYEVAISCGHALTLLALAGVWGALQDARHGWRWLAAASLAYGLAVGARPSLLFGAVILLVPAAQAWRERRRGCLDTSPMRSPDSLSPRSGERASLPAVLSAVGHAKAEALAKAGERGSFHATTPESRDAQRPLWPLLAAAAIPISLIGLGLMLYNALRFDNPLEFGQQYQLPLRPLLAQFRPSYLWFNIRVGFLEPARWSGHFPFVDDIAPLAPPTGYSDVQHPFGILTNIPLVWLALAAPLAWRRRSADVRSKLRWFLAAVALLFGMCALPLVLHHSMCSRYQMEFAPPLVLLAVIGVFALDRALAGQAVWRRAARCGWGLLLVFSTAFNLLATFQVQTETHTLFGNALARTGSVDPAIAQYQQALECKPENLEAHGGLGCLLLQKGRVEEANAHFQSALELAPDDAQAHRRLGGFLLGYGRADEAIAQYQKALQIEPDILEAQGGLGCLLLQKGRVVEANTHLQKALELEPDHAEAHSDLGDFLLRNGRADEAIPQYQKALQIKPGETEVLYNLGNALLQAGRGDEAISRFQEALAIEPKSTAVLNNLGNALLQRGAADEAIPYFQKALAIQPDFTLAHYNLGGALLQKGRVDEAITHFQKAVEIRPDYADAYANLGVALSQKGQTKEAIASWRRTLEIKPDQVYVQNNLAWLLATSPDAPLRDGAKAVALAERANQLTGGGNPMFLRTLAAAYAEAGRFSEALETAARALRPAQAQSNMGLAGALQSEMKLYQAGSPYHSPQLTH